MSVGAWRSRTHASKPPVYESLDPGRIVKTMEQLLARIQARFPEGGLSRVCAELIKVARKTARQAEQLSHPNWPLRFPRVR